MNEMQTGTTELDAAEARETAGGSLWTWLFGEPTSGFGGFGGGSSGGGGARDRKSVV